MFARRIAVVGTGYVGLTAGACLASLGHRVVCADVDEAKVDRLRTGEIGILEDGLAELVSRRRRPQEAVVRRRRAAALEELDSTGSPLDVMFLCVPDPDGVGGIADLSAVESVMEEVRDQLPAAAVVVNKSTVPVGTATRTAELLDRDDVAVVCNPEFLREGSRWMTSCTRTGSWSARAAGRRRTCRRAVCGVGCAEACHRRAQRGDGEVCGELLSGDEAVLRQRDRRTMRAAGRRYRDGIAGMGYDPRIGRAFLPPGPGWGGSCLPKDTRALLQRPTRRSSTSPYFARRLTRTTAAGADSGQGGSHGVRRVARRHTVGAARAGVQGRHRRPARFARRLVSPPCRRGRRGTDWV